MFTWVDRWPIAKQDYTINTCWKSYFSIIALKTIYSINLVKTQLLNNKWVEGICQMDGGYIFVSVEWRVSVR